MEIILMSLQNLPNDKLQTILMQVNQSLYNHEQWYKDLVRTFSCRTLFNRQDTEKNSHTLCRFGQWYYSDAFAKLHEYSEFSAIGKTHFEMHNEVRNILIKLEEKGIVATHDYDSFSNSLDRFRLEMSRLKNEIENLLHYRDPLTMTISRANMLPILREKQLLTKRQSDSSCLAMLDIYFFKKINDTYGHIVGDKVLASLCRHILGWLRNYDKVFRYGGEEFLILLQHIDIKKAFELIDQLRKKVESLEIEVEMDTPINITVSIGITELNSDDTIEDIIDHADKALYLAKSSGRNCTKVWNKK